MRLLYTRIFTLTSIENKTVVLRQLVLASEMIAGFVALSLLI